MKEQDTQRGEGGKLSQADQKIVGEFEDPTDQAIARALINSRVEPSDHLRERVKNITESANSETSMSLLEKIFGYLLGKRKKK